MTLYKFYQGQSYNPVQYLTMAFKTTMVGIWVQIPAGPLKRG